MKKLIFISSLVFALLLMFACNEEDAVNKKVEPNYPPPHFSATPQQSFYDSVGLLHKVGSKNSIT